MSHILCVLGTRPEVVKLAPVIRALQPTHQVDVCSTAQHDAILTNMLVNCNVRVALNTSFIRDQPLEEMTARLVNYLSWAITSLKPNLVIVQGDTTTAFAGALAAFYNQVPVAHVEAGLRTNNRYYPFPEEMNRRLIARLASLHFAPTPRACMNLRAEHVTGHVEETGNTIVDELMRVIPTLEPWRTDYERVVLVTCHRREDQIERVTALREQLVAFAAKESKTVVVWSLHPNPRIQEIAHTVIHPDNLLLTEALDYREFLSVLMRADLVVTDSGGVVEEATTLRRPLLVIRDETERPEANAPLVALPEMHMLADHMRATLDVGPLRVRENVWRFVRHLKMPRFDTTFGEGNAGPRIANAIQKWLL